MLKKSKVDNTACTQCSSRKSAYFTKVCQSSSFQKVFHFLSMGRMSCVLYISYPFAGR